MKKKLRNLLSLTFASVSGMCLAGGALLLASAR